MALPLSLNIAHIPSLATTMTHIELEIVEADTPIDETCIAVAAGIHEMMLRYCTPEQIASVMTFNIGRLTSVGVVNVPQGHQHTVQ